MRDLPPHMTKAETAAFVGSSIAAMDRGHDALHRALCRFLGAPSYALGGGPPSPRAREFAVLEEEAVLFVQRWMTALGLEAPQ